MRNKWVDLMIRRGGLACAEMTYGQNHSPSNFRAMCRARVIYEAAVEAIGKDVVVKSQKNGRYRHSARPCATQTAAYSKVLISRPGPGRGGRFSVVLGPS